MERIRELHDYTTESPPAPSEVLGLIVLRNAERIQAANLATVRSNLEVHKEAHKKLRSITCDEMQKARTCRLAPLGSVPSVH